LTIELCKVLIIDDDEGVCYSLARSATTGAVTNGQTPEAGCAASPTW
jgi:hypothetical protein